MTLFQGVVAVANVTGEACDADTKYWCFSVDYTPNTNFVSVNTVKYTGGLGGASTSYQRNITALWRQDPATGIWYNLRNDGQSRTDPLAYSDNQIHVIYHDFSYGGYQVSDWADVQTQDIHKANTGNFFCGYVVDFHLSSPSGVWIENSGGGGPC